jgi:hypothetical protein
MRVNRRISSALVMIFVLLLSTSLPAAAGSSSLMENSTAVFTTIDFVSNIETIGVAVSGTGLPPTAELSYRQSGEGLWHSGHPLMRIDDGRLIGSLFNLSPATSYDIKVLDGSSEINGSVSTQPDQLSFTPSVILYVNDDALPDGDGSATTPFQTIQEAVNQAGPGTQVLVADGIYREAITLPISGTAGNWIQVKAAGNAAILDSADRLSGDIWTPYSTSHVWFTKINGPVAYLARDGKRYYQYDDRTGLMQAVGHGGVTMNEGWYFEPSTLRLYVRSLDDPANHIWQVPRLNHAFDLAARDWIWIEGFEIQFYGTTTNGCGVCTINASHIVIRRNKIHNMQLGVFINWTGTEDQGNDTRIVQNEVYDPLVNEWPWTAVKGSFMEGTGIIVRGHIGAIVRDNNVHNFFNGIYTGSSGALENPELAFDADIYRNYIHHISDDGLEPEGACINQRFRNNTVDRSYIGISLAPITQGPTWVLRSTFTNFTGRGIKFADNSDGIVLIYQNTGWTNASNINGMDLITSIHNVVMRNNTFQSSGYSFAEVPTGSTANDWNHNNWYTTRGSTGPHFKWENVNYNTISALCTASGLECDGYENFPGFTNPTGGDFTLLPSSPNIDRGVVIPGINDDFVGNAPDVGAYEFAFDPPTFVDVPTSYWAWEYIERLYDTGVTSGCNTSPLMYCPATPVTRDQMAVFLLRAKHGSGYVPPAPTGMFQDVPTDHWAAAWIEQLAAEGITSGCSVNPKQYCPTTAVTRDQMAVFLLRGKHGSGYLPPTPTGLFQDVPTDFWAASWIEQLAAEGITGGCSVTPKLYCPTTPVTRDQMAVFLVRNFSLP